MLILDEQRVQRNAKGQAQEAYADLVKNWIDEQLSHRRVISDRQMAPCNPQYQMGKMYDTSRELEAVLTKFSSNFVFQHTLKPGKKRLCFLEPGIDQGLKTVCIYEAGATPEHSIFNAQFRWEPDPDFALGKRTMERDEVRGTPVSNQEVYSLIMDLGMKGASEELLRRRNDMGLDDPDYRPGFIRVLENWNEAVRGWRTVIATVLREGYITLDQAKKAVAMLDGTEDRASWARITGQRAGLELGY